MIPVTSTDEAAYERCLTDVAERIRRLDELRVERETLADDLARFEKACHGRVGDLLAELKRVGGVIADHERRLQRLDDDPDADPEADLEADADGSEVLDTDPTAFADSAMGGDNGHADPADAGPRRPPRGSRENEAEAKRLYRALAKRCHPDFARDDPERLRRVALMQRVNEAYRARDLTALRRLDREAEAADPAFTERPLAERLAWVRADLSRLEAELADLRIELAIVRGSGVHRLWRRFEAGEPILDALEDDLEKRLRKEGRRLDRLVAAFRIAVDERRTREPVGAAPVG